MKATFEIKLLEEAQNDIKEINKYLRRNCSKQAAVRVYKDIFDSIKILKVYPESCQYLLNGVTEIFKNSGFRVLVVKNYPYKIIYRIDNEIIYIQRVLHNARDIEILFT